MAFAENTSVPVERSRAEIEKLLTRAGATTFASGWDAGSAVISFRAHDRFLRFVLTLPKLDEKRFWRHGRASWRRVPESKAKVRLDQEIRRLWRCLALVIKAKLEAVDSGIVSFEQEFLPFIILPDGSTVAQAVLPQIAETYATGKMPTGLLLGPAREPEEG